MKSLANEVLAVISNNNKTNGVSEIVKLVKDMRSAGLLSTPTYTLPMVGTIGKIKQPDIKTLDYRNFTDTFAMKKPTNTNHEASGW